MKILQKFITIFYYSLFSLEGSHNSRVVGPEGQEANAEECGGLHGALLHDLGADVSPHGLGLPGPRREPPGDLPLLQGADHAVSRGYLQLPENQIQLRRRPIRRHHYPY